MKPLKYAYQKEYSFEIFFKPTEITHIHEKILLINQESDKNFKYGLFDPSKTEYDLQQLYKNMLVCIMYKNNIPIGFYYYYILSEVKNDVLIHFGLIVIHNNKSNLFVVAEAMGMKILKQKYKKFIFTTITTVPKVLEQICLAFDDVFPNPTNRLLARPPKEYVQKIEVLCDKYVDIFFPNDLISVDRKRFILVLEKRENGFDDKFHKLPKANNLIFNLFCQNWLDYESEEDMIIMGRAGYLMLLKIHIILLVAKIRSGLYAVR